jgi:tyrosine-protein phosphatase 2/3
MLTREVESSLTKCGKYWKDGQYGDVALRLVSQKGVDDEKSKSYAPSGYFQTSNPKEIVPDTIIERVFELRNRTQPHVPPRRITHLQYLGWPDMDVPRTPGGLLTLIRQVNIATNEHIHDAAKVKQGPVLLHCSAGVGRTGGFLLVDSILAGIRHEMMRNGSPLGQNQSSSSSEEMDIDEPESVISSGKPLSSNPDDYSSRSSIPPSTSGSESAFISTTNSLLSSSMGPPSSEWSKRPTRGSSTATKLSPVATNKSRKLSDLVAENLKKASHASPSSPKAQVAAWSKRLVPSSTRHTPPNPFEPMSSEELTTKSGINYKLPRKLDDLRGSPPMPSAFTEPIREVLEDMREQRMSLCQSLRQYVFVHLAIIKGALDLVDEAAEAKRLNARKTTRTTTSGASGASASNELAWSSTSSISSTGEEGPPSSSPTRILAGRFSSRDREGSQSSSVASSPPPPPRALTGKRTASPTRINMGEAKLLKRPSLKRKHKTGDSQNDDDMPRGSATRQHVLPSTSRDR